MKATSEKKKQKKVIFRELECDFYIDTNNLVPPDIIKFILGKLETTTIQELNKILKGIKIYIGGNHWHYNEKGYIKYQTYEFNFNNMTLLIFLNKIFELGYERWRNSLYGALRRYVWESFFHELIMSVVQILRIDLTMVDLVKNKNLNTPDDRTTNLVNKLFNYDNEAYRTIDFFTINSVLWKETLPEDLGFLYTLYSRRINLLKKKSSKSYLSQFEKIKLYNELRKIKMGYKYEYNLSELVNYCIHSEHFEPFFRYNTENYSKMHREFYYKAKRQILKFFKKYDITNELNEYRDKANRIHYFLTHTTFERVKSACLQVCLANINNKYLKEYDSFKSFYDTCPICGKKDINQINCEKFYFSSRYSYFKELLITNMKNTETLEDLNTNEFYFGIPCEDCFKVIRNIQGKYDDLDEVQNFVRRYSVCPICGSKNHLEYLLDFYYDDNRDELKGFLLKNMGNKNHLKNFNINLGIPCCNCFSKIFERDPDDLRLVFNIYE
ncbi:MAG: hypothetical protein GF353_24650 [Candidatus Lokiarchaeota archaeon]|nr:hypothetical protein [Candidatus Lokiarchaeota archaeon]